MGQKIKTAEKKSLSSQQWIKRQLADPWSERARAEGWRSRGAEPRLAVHRVTKILPYAPDQQAALVADVRA